MIHIFGRKVKVQTGTKSQTVNICTSDNIHGVYDYIVRLRPPFITEETLLQRDFKSVEEVVTFLQRHHSSQIEKTPGVPSLRSAPRGRPSATANGEALVEASMARETHDLLTQMGLKPHFRIDVCSKFAVQFPPDTCEHGLPLYSKQTQACFTDKARQVARPDLIVVDTKAKTVELIVEFETDTNPKNLVGNYFCVFLAEEYKPKNDSTVYRLDITRTAHFLLACLNSRAATPNEQAAIEKGKMVAEWLEMTSVHLAGNVEACNIRKAHAVASDDWQAMKAAFGQQVKSTCPHLF